MAQSELGGLKQSRPRRWTIGATLGRRAGNFEFGRNRPRQFIP